MPQQRRPDHLAVLIEADHAVLLGSHREGSDAVKAASRGQRRIQRMPPGGGVDLGARRVGGPALPHQRPAPCLTDHHLA